MALSQSAVSELLEAFRTGDGVDLIRESVRMVMQELIEAEADRADRRRPAMSAPSPAPPTATGPVPGCWPPRPATWSCGSPSCARGRSSRSILEPRRRIDQALYAVVMEAYVAGVSTRAVDDLVAALGIDSGISKSEVSRICAGLDEVVERVPDPAAGPHRVPLRLPRRDLPARAQRHLPGGLDGRRGGHRDHRRRRPGGPRSRRRRQRGRGVLARLPDRAEEARPGRGAAGDLRPARRPGHGAAPLLPRRSPPALPGPLRPQPARTRAQDATPTWSPRCSAPSSPNPTPRPSRRPGTRSATSSPSGSPRSGR